jgi:hypothetical protein
MRSGSSCSRGAVSSTGMYLAWIRAHKWKLLLGGLVLLLLISPVAKIYDDQDNVISPLMAVLFLAVTFGASRHKQTWIVLTVLIVVWLVISVLTAGSGLFAGESLLAPVLFLLLLALIFSLLLHWLIGAALIDAEVLSAAICGYLLIGLLWASFDALVLVVDPKAFATSTNAPVVLGDLLYFSYSTLTTVAFGDITPRDPLVRMVTIMEAIVGIFYNIIVIARFVGLYGLRTKGTEPQ